MQDVRIPLDHRTGYAKGYALIVYESHEEALEAVENGNNSILLENSIECDFCFRKK